MAKRTCSLTDCDKLHKGKGLCSTHHQRYLRRGDPLHNLNRIDSNVDDRYEAYVNRDGPTPGHWPELGSCWLWTGAISNRGYAVISVTGTSKSAHRWAYSTFNGPIPDGFYIDHLCREKTCVNPSHLEAVTPKENQRRGWIANTSDEDLLAEATRRGLLS